MNNNKHQGGKDVTGRRLEPAYGTTETINAESLARADTLNIDCTDILLEASLGDIVRITGVDGASRDYVIDKASATEFLLKMRK